ncbi:MAG: hypothetical protein U5J83_08785 [Bryobacterales bacterium]|nr:hypothetical protein [Bryobacterales bacterium]
MPSSSDQGVTNMRVDHRFTENDSFFFRYSVTRNTRKDQGWGLGPADPNARNDQRDNHAAVVNYTKVLTPTTLNDLRVAASRQWLPFEHPSFDQAWPQQLGYPNIIPQDQFPPVTVSGLLGIGSASFSAGVRAQQYVQIVDSMTFHRGNAHDPSRPASTLRWYRLSFINRFRPSGFFQFRHGHNRTTLRRLPARASVWLAICSAKSPVAAMGSRPFFQFRALPLGLYFQDDWKVARNLTLNLGVRYDISFGPTELHDRHSNFDPFVTNPDNGFLGTMVYRGVGEPSNAPSSTSTRTTSALGSASPGIPAAPARLPSVPVTD